MSAIPVFAILGGLAAGLFFIAKGGDVSITVGKKYRVTSLLRGADPDLIRRCLNEFGAENIQFTTDRVIYTVTATRTKTLKLGVDKFGCADPSTQKVSDLFIDNLQDA